MLSRQSLTVIFSVTEFCSSFRPPPAPCSPLGLPLPSLTLLVTSGAVSGTVSSAGVRAGRGGLGRKCVYSSFSDALLLAIQAPVGPAGNRSVTPGGWGTRGQGRPGTGLPWCHGEDRLAETKGTREGRWQSRVEEQSSLISGAGVA